MQARLGELTRLALPATGVGGLAVTGLGLLRGMPLRAALAADLAGDLTLAGFVAIADVIRPDSPEIVKDLAAAGVRVAVITGDHPVTAAAIARKAGIPDAEHAVTGDELDRLAEARRRDKVGTATVFARVSPEQKVRIVADLQRDGHVVAMTGDGSNDAAAIRLADVGIGVAARGSTARWPSRSAAGPAPRTSAPAR